MVVRLQKSARDLFEKVRRKVDVVEYILHMLRPKNILIAQVSNKQLR